MRFFGVGLAAVVLILPGLAGGQAVSSLPDPGGAAGPPMPGELRSGGPGGPAAPGPLPPARMRGPGPVAWWKDSEMARKLGLSEDQMRRIEQTFLEYRLRLVDLRADLEKQELGLPPLVDADRPDEAKVAAQIDLITTARGKLEKENALMLLAIRRVLSADQWKRLQTLQQERARGSHAGPPSGPPAGPEGRR